MPAAGPLPHQGSPLYSGQQHNLTGRQQGLLEELVALDPELGKIYLQALRLLVQDDPGTVYLLAHAGRELALGVVSLAPAEGWGPSDQANAEIPDNERNRGKIATSLRLDPFDARVTTWFDLYNALVGAAHHRRGRHPPELESVREDVRRLDELLYGRIGPYFETEAELDELLSISEPTPVHAEQLQAVMLRPQQRRYFFGKLSSPAWVSLLEQSSVFDRPPGRVDHADGTWQSVTWHEGRYLSRIASEEPELVVDIICRIPVTNLNPDVWLVAAQVAARVPPHLGLRLVRQLVNVASNVPAFFFFGPLIDFLCALANEGNGEAFDLADALLYVVYAGDVGDTSPYTLEANWMFPRLQSVDVSLLVDEAIPALWKSDPGRTVSLLVGKLHQAAAVARHLDRERILRFAFEDDDPGAHNPLPHLVRATTRLLTKFAATDAESAGLAIEMMDGGRSILSDKLKYRVIAAAGQYLPEELDAVLVSPLILEPGQLGREVAMVVREQYGNGSELARRILRYALHLGPSPDVVAEMLLRWGDDSSLEDQIQGIKRRWQQQRLTWFRGKIPEELRDLAVDLDLWDKKPTLREQEMAEIGSYSEASSGSLWEEPRPYSVDELRSESASRIVRLMSRWKPSDSSLEKGTTRGFELSLHQVAIDDPMKALDIFESAGQELTVGFAVCLLEALQEVIRNEAVEEFDWDRLITSLEAILKGNGLDRETDSAKRIVALRSVATLLELATTADSIPLHLYDDLWRVISLSAQHELAWLEETEDEFDSFDGVLSAAINRTGARIVGAAILAGLNCHRRLEEDGSANAVEAVEARLAPILDTVLQQSGRTRAAAEAKIGQFLPLLFSTAPTWLAEHLMELLECGATDPIRHPAWGAYITTARLYESDWTVLRPWYSEAAAAAGTELGRVTADQYWSLTKGLVVQVLAAILGGLASPGDSDQLVEMTFANVPLEERKHAYWGVFAGWPDSSSEVSPLLVDRLLELWQWRLDQIAESVDSAQATEEATGLGWFLHIRDIPDAEFLRLGLRTMRAAEGKVSMHVPWDRLSLLGRTEPEAVCAFTEGVVAAQLSEQHHHVAVEEISAVLKVLSEAPSVTVKLRARRLADRLGEAGYGEFKALARRPRRLRR